MSRDEQRRAEISFHFIHLKMSRDEQRQTEINRDRDKQRQRQTEMKAIILMISLKNFVIKRTFYYKSTTLVI